MKKPINEDLEKKLMAAAVEFAAKNDFYASIKTRTGQGSNKYIIDITFKKQGESTGSTISFNIKETCIVQCFTSYPKTEKEMYGGLFNIMKAKRIPCVYMENQNNVFFNQFGE